MSRSFDSTSLTSLPSMAIVPALISSRPASIRSSVDLPQPDGPTNTMNSPLWMSNSMPCMTRVTPYFFSTARKETAAMASTLHCAGGEPTDHVALECVVDGRGRRGIDESDGHQQLPG